MNAFVFQAFNGFSEVSLSQATSGSGEIPPLPSSYYPNRRGGFVEKKVQTLKKRYSFSRYDIVDEMKTYVGFCHKISRLYDPLFSQFDKDEILPTTCAMGFTKPHHTDLEFLGELDPEHRSSFNYDPAHLEAMNKFYSKYKVKDHGDDYSLSFPRGKNLGFPHPISGKRRGLTDVLLALHVALALGGRKAGMTLEEVTRFLESYHGPDFFLYAERYQNTARPQPLRLIEGDYVSTSFEFRVRGIYMSSKYKVAWNRRFVKKVLKDIMNHPAHNQDRSAIIKTIKRYKDLGWLIKATDISRFDQAHGGERGEEIVSLMCKIWGSESDKVSLMHEFNSTLLTMTREGAFDIEGRPILPSGASFTTVLGCVGNSTIVIGVVSVLLGVSYDEAVNLHGSSWDYLAWGDDLLLFLKDKSITDQDIIDAYASFMIKVDFEPATRYLGTLYGPGEYTGSITLGYPVSRAVQTQWFPERQKLYPFNTIGYVARLQLMDQSAAPIFHEMTMKMWDEEKQGPKFAFSDKSEVLLALLPEVQKHSDKIGEIDDVLNLFVHGLAGEIGPDQITGLGDFEEFLGLGQVDVSDPAQFLRNDVDDVPISIIGDIKQLQNGDFSVYKRIMISMVEFYNLTWRMGDVLY